MNINKYNYKLTNFVNVLLLCSERIKYLSYMLSFSVDKKKDEKSKFFLSLPYQLRLSLTPKANL